MITTLQHALSITSDGLLMLFNDGLGSVNQSAGEAMEVWDYDAGQTIYSPICSSAYEAPDQSILVDYATASNGTEALLVGLDSSHNVVFEFKYPTSG